MDEINKQDSVTRIAKGTRVKADIKTESDIHVAGFVEGHLETSTRLVISESGKITGTVTANSASISGKLTGELRVLNHISLSKTAFVDGVMFSKIISVDEGAKLVGILNVGDDVDVMNAKLRKAEKRAIQPNKNNVPSDKEDSNADKEISEHKQLVIEDPEPNKPKQNRYLKPVLIGVPGSLKKNKAESIRHAAEHFMNSLGFSLEIFSDPENDPFYQNLSYTRKSPESADDIQKRFVKAKETIESALLNKGNTEASNELQKAANSIVKELKELDEFVIVLGEVVLIQLLEDDVQTIAAEVVADELKQKLIKMPEMVTSPYKVYSHISD